MVCRGGLAQVARGTALLGLALSAGWLLGRGGGGLWQLLLPLTGLVGLALLTTQRQNAAVRGAAEAERKRLSAELHDGVATQLASLTWSLSALRRSQKSAEDAAQELTKLESSVRAAQTELRRVVLDLRTPERSLGAWSAQLEQRVRELAASHSAAYAEPCRVALKLTGDGARSISGAASEQLERAVMEGVYNALRHANCKNICVDITALEGIEIEVRDDGVGMPLAESAAGGLANLRARARSLQGQCSVLSGEGGTRVRLSVPLVA